MGKLCPIDGSKQKAVDDKIIARLNALWGAIYPHLAQWIGRWAPKGPGWVLELGPFSGGISHELVRLFPQLRAVCLVQQDAVARIIKNHFALGLEIVVGSPSSSPWRPCFDLAVVRGAFFFLTPGIIVETFRVLRPGSHALLGGGYGPLTPSEEITKIAEESKRLNYELGKKHISRKELETIVRNAGMSGSSQILEEGGLWLLLRK